MSKFIKCILFTLALFVSSNEAHAKENYYKIAIIMPMNHHAMNDIVDGFKEHLESEIKGEYKLTIYNAQCDPNLMSSLGR